MSSRLKCSALIEMTCNKLEFSTTFSHEPRKASLTKASLAGPQRRPRGSDAWNQRRKHCKRRPQIQIGWLRYQQMARLNCLKSGRPGIAFPVKIPRGILASGRPKLASLGPASRRRAGPESATMETQVCQNRCIYYPSIVGEGVGGSNLNSNLFQHILIKSALT